VRPRWQDWVIALALVALGVTGIWTIWGGDLVRLVHPAEAHEPPVATPASGGP
jgi:cytochrome b subunit of formate dehydrogenase